MGCCLSREDDRFNSGSEALLPKRRNGNKRVDKSVDMDLAKKDGANGSYKSPSAVVAAGDATSKVSVKPQLPKKAVESVDLLGLNGKTPTPLAAPVIKAPSVPEPTPTVESAPILSEPTAALNSPSKLVAYEPTGAKEPLPSKSTTKEPSPSRPTHASTPKVTESLLSKQTKSSSRKERKAPPETSPTKLSETENQEVIASAFTSVSVKVEDGDNDINDDDKHGNKDYNGGNAMGKPKDPKPKKNAPTKKSKKKRKKGKK